MKLTFNMQIKVDEPANVFVFEVVPGVLGAFAVLLAGFRSKIN